MKPKALHAGDTITLVSPASPLAEEKLLAVTTLLEGEGYRVKLSPHALEADHHLAGTDEDRARDLQEAFADESTDAILCTRGGYGCARLFPHLDVARMAGSGKMFLGFSDITTLHLALNGHGLPTVHAPMALTLHYPREPWVIQSFLNALKGDATVRPDVPRGETVVGGTADGVVTGGCLCLLMDSVGTAYPLETEGKILLIEDVDEAPHRVDAMLTHLLNCGLAQTAEGFVIGEMTGSDGKVDAGIGGKPWREIAQERLAPLGKPMIVNYPFGHARNMLTLPLGIRASLDADQGTLTYTESLCA